MIESIVGSLNAGAKYIIPLLLVGIPFYALSVKKVKVYEVFVEGAKDGFKVALRIIPYLVAILVAVDMLRASGVLGAMVGLLSGITGRFGLPAEALPMALVAVSFFGLSSCNSSMALSPKGVAAFPRPSILADILSMIEPIAG